MFGVLRVVKRATQIQVVKEGDVSRRLELDKLPKRLDAAGWVQI